MTVARSRTSSTSVDPTPGGLDLEGYRDVVVRVHRGEPYEGVLASHGLDLVSWAEASSAWVARLTLDPRASARFTLLCRRDLAGAAPARRARGSRWTPPADRTSTARVRSRGCPRCGAHKRTAGVGPWIHCDHCAALFDYDVAWRPDVSAFSPQESWLELMMILDAEPWPEEGAGLERAYADGHGWAHRVQLELFPAAYPARAREARYAAALVDGWLVPSQFAFTFDRHCKQSAAALEKTYQASLHRHAKPRLADVLGLLKATRVLLDAQCAVLHERRLFAAHPDGMDERLHRRASDGAFVAGWLGRLGPRDGDALLAEAGLADEFISLPTCALRPCVCAHCGADVASMEGAASTVCGGCGRCLEAGSTFECRGCSAPVLRSEAEPATSCAYCGMRWEAVGG